MTDEPAPQTRQKQVVEAPAVVEETDEPAPKARRQVQVEPEPAPDVIEVPQQRRQQTVVVEEGRGSVDPRAEREARRLLNNGGDIERMSGDELRGRLEQMRGLLADGNLEPRTARELRRRVLAERDILRQSVAVEDARQDGELAPPPRQANANNEIRIILGDRRTGDVLSLDELNRRIQIYRDIEQDPVYGQYATDDRLRWRRSLQSDRDILRRRLLQERAERSNELTVDLSRGKIDVEIGINVPPVKRRDVFVAEANDEEIEDILVSAPTSRPKRRYTIEEIVDEPEVRNTLPRLEIDNVRFGFNEAFVREEEVRGLDRIAAIMERILKRYPREIFMIEGHTDAVGSDVYNLGLSRERAEAIKRALTTYYVIPPQNLRTVGLGERYLKVPTPEAEPENRRVSISRVTQFLGSAQ